MSRVTLFSAVPLRVAYPSASFGTPDRRSMLGLYAFGATSASTVVPSIGVVTTTEDVVTYLSLQEGVA